MLYLPQVISIIEVLLVTVPVLLTVAFVTIAERKTMASMQRRLGPNLVGYYGLLQAFADALKLLFKQYVSMASKAVFNYYACFNLHYFGKLMLNSTLFKLIIFVFSIFCLYIIEMESSFFNTLLLVLFFIFYTYRIYCKAKFNLNLWIYFTVLLLLSLSVLAISWAIIIILFKGLTGFLPSFIFWLSLLPDTDTDNFLENYLVLTEPSGSNNFNGSHGEGSGGSNGNPGSTGPGGNTGPNGGLAAGNHSHGGNSQSDDDNHGIIGPLESYATNINRIYSSNGSEAGTRNPLYTDGTHYMCKHYGNLDRIPSILLTQPEAGEPEVGVRCCRVNGYDGVPMPQPVHPLAVNCLSHQLQIVPSVTGGWKCKVCWIKICDSCTIQEMSGFREILPTITQPTFRLAPNQ